MFAATKDMRTYFSAITIVILVSALAAPAQDKSAPRTVPSEAAQTRPQTPVDLTGYGVRLQPDARLIVMMAALDAAGFDPTPQGQEPSAFRTQVRREQRDLDVDLRQRLHVFFERSNRTLSDSNPAEQAARYVSLAHALGPAPSYEAPPRTDDLPGGLLEVLDFTPLLREFYRKSGIDERLPEYIRKYQAEGDHLRPAAIELVRSVAAYLHTRPVTSYTEQVPVRSPDKKKNPKTRYEPREHERNFFIVPDLLAVPGTINFRVIADDYYAIVPFGINPASSELRRAYIRFMIDPIVLHFNRDISARRAQVRSLLDERIAAKEDVSTDVFLAVSRSLVVATDVRMEQTARVDALTREARSRIAVTTDTAARAAIAKNLEQQRAVVSDAATAQLAEGYERGAVLAFFFAEQLEGIESSGFDIANFLGDMIATFDPVREGRRISENAEARKRALDARKLRQAQIAANSDSMNSAGPSALIKGLAAVDDLLRVKNYAEAETRLQALMKDYQREPRIFFALGQAASLSAEDAIDEDVQRERLNRALGHYRLAINAAAPDTDRALVQRSYAAAGRIYEFFDNAQEARNAFDAAIKLGPVDPVSYDEALKGKARLEQPR